MLDLVENSVTAGAKQVSVAVEEDPAAGLLLLSVSDDGDGMAPEFARVAVDPYTTSRSTRQVGLGLALLAGAAEQAGGRIEVASRPHEGTRVRAWFQFSHLDRAPLGRVEDTLAAVAALHPDLDLRFRHRGPEGCYELKLRELDRGSGPAEIKRRIADQVEEGRRQIGSTA